MYSDNDKDVLNNFDDMQNDAVSWDTIIDADDNGIVSIKDDNIDNISPQNLDTEVFTNESISADDYEDLKGIVADIESNPSYSDTNDIDEDELKRILSEDDEENVYNLDEAVQQEQAADESTIPIEEEQDEITPRKEEIKKRSVSPLLLILLVILIAAGAGYFIMNSNSSNNEPEIPQVVNPQPAEQITNQGDIQPPNDNIQETQIPVVNEDETSTLKPDEKQEEEKEEKKEVINVIPTGRPNPFMPLSKYAVKNETKIINNIDYDSVNIPKPPAEYGKISQFTEKLMSIVVSGIMYDKNKPSAIITYEGNDYFVQIGDMLDRFQIIDISPTFVKIALGKNVYKANIGEEFKIKDFFGNNLYKNGNRQYYSSEDEFKSSRDGINGYTSNSDVAIHTK